MISLKLDKNSFVVQISSKLAVAMKAGKNIKMTQDGTRKIFENGDSSLPNSVLIQIKPADSSPNSNDEDIDIKKSISCNEHTNALIKNKLILEHLKK